MKGIKKIAGMLLSSLLVVGMTGTVYGANNNEHTITITNEKSGHTYEAYRVFEGDMNEEQTILSNIAWSDGVDGKALLTSLQTMEAYADCETAQDVAEVLKGFGDDSAQLDAFADVVAQHLQSPAGTSVETKGSSSSTYAISVSGDGYYFVKDAGNIGSADVATKYILQVVKDVTLAAKSEVPTLEKSIVEGDVKTSANNASVGDVISYELTSKVPAMDGYDKYYFIVYDALDESLTFNDDVVITVGDKTLEKDTDYLLSQDGQLYKIVFVDFIQYKDTYKDAPITITYSATLNEKAAIGNFGNYNSAILEYSNNPNIELKGENEPADEDGTVTGKTPASSVITYTAGIKLCKVTEDGTALTGAKFKISGEAEKIVLVNEEVYRESSSGTWYRLKDGTYTETAPITEGADANAHLYDSTEIVYEKITEVVKDTVKEDIVTDGWVNADGVLTFVGLGAGTYTITEIEAPDGYNLLDEPMTLELLWANPLGRGLSIWSAYIDDESLVQDENYFFTFDVVNKAGAVLPSTGGIGTTVFYIVGSVLTLSAAALLLIKRCVISRKNVSNT